MARARMLRWGTRATVVAALALPVVALFGWAALAALYEMLLLACLAARWAFARQVGGFRRALAAVAAAMAILGLFGLLQIPLAQHDSLYAINVAIAVSLEVLLMQALLCGGAAYLVKRSIG